MIYIVKREEPMLRRILSHFVECEANEVKDEGDIKWAKRMVGVLDDKAKREVKYPYLPLDLGGVE